MHLVPLPPTRDLRAIVRGYWLVDDSEATLLSDGLRCGPGVGAVVCVQFADLVDGEFGPALEACLTGVQDRARHYRPRGRTRSLLILFSELGATRLFPGLGRDIAGTSIDLAAVVGDGEVGRLRRSAGAAPDAAALAAETDRWLLRRLERTGEAAGLRRLAAAASLLTESGRSVAAAAAAVDLSVRQLERVFDDHVGITPKRFQTVHRLQRSVHAAMSGLGDPLHGFADQAHQIRAWKKGLGFTPGEARRRGLSEAAARYFQAPACQAHAYALYL